MSYSAKLNGVEFFNTNSYDPSLAVSEAEVHLILGAAGSATFTIPPHNKLYDNFHKFVDYIEIFRDDRILFEGRVSDVSKSFDTMLTVEFEGLLAVLNDSVCKIASYKSSSSSMVLANTLGYHNSMVELKKKIFPGRVSAVNSISMDFGSYDSTISRIQNIVNEYGGYLVLSKYFTFTPLTITRNIEYGMIGEDVLAVQDALQNLSYYYGDLDGEYGDLTYAAVTAFQRDNGLAQDGMVGLDTITVINQKLSRGLYVETDRYLEYDDYGDDVLAMQKCLVTLGYYHGDLDGMFGDLTLAAVKAFQEEIGYTQDGVAGPATIAALNEQFKTGLYLDWLTEKDFKDNDQVINFGKNLLDISQKSSVDGDFSRLVPLGKNIDYGEGDSRPLTIESVMGVDYIENERAVNRIGYVTATNTWSDIEDVYELIEVANAYSEYVSSDRVTISVTATDLANAGFDVSHFNIGENHTVIAIPHGIRNSKFTCYELKFNLLDPSADELTLSNETKGFVSETRRMVSGSSGGVKFSSSSSEGTGVDVSVRQTLTDGVEIASIFINNEETKLYSPRPSEASLNVATKILVGTTGDIEIPATGNYYAEREINITPDSGYTIACYLGCSVDGDSPYMINVYKQMYNNGKFILGLTNTGDNNQVISVRYSFLEIKTA